jgi:hypothetical protein
VDGTEGSENVGWTVATAGDVNGDGYADVQVGAYRADEGFLDAGRVRLSSSSLRAAARPSASASR